MGNTLKGVPFVGLQASLFGPDARALRGQGWPHPFFDRSTGEPIRTPIVLTRPEREALRPA
ncbi:MAG: hypothetical protein IPJ34_08710 [Myxococcales bacterium]|nr:hypothetical protein [Myxococcales bacterium]